LKETTAAARKLGIFGAPTFAIDTEIFGAHIFSEIIPKTFTEAGFRRREIAACTRRSGCSSSVKFVNREHSSELARVQLGECAGSI
jgi:hypothetical protein